ncbi:hypothetical protein SPRG_03142 [Saprolegnia parasitica CBS 223.65]|uniref:Uncharacterized protein n=1 Tax=Saprolegnia parasitica (strain CBS 223.65) TaxID=695850 RepID=A0A067CZH2_SAPPC|nr:hypothetical protein SPRG_03142 [Saprolegnia parasitica CBS 223.65]KDO31926.1 hypothetical protein SPRG_03142 [Saprolegnia parasitica CBS 223.65]|eukprot:XP_012197125.1 hypothetical protein SPRG_03142 [Saprolegnia parasitica CBS 223.65]
MATRGSTSSYDEAASFLPKSRSTLVEELTAKYMGEAAMRPRETLPPTTSGTSLSFHESSLHYAPSYEPPSPLTTSSASEPNPSYIATIQPSSASEVAAADHVVHRLVQDAYRAIDEMKQAHQVLFNNDTMPQRYDSILAEAAATSVEKATRALTRARDHFRDFCSVATQFARDDPITSSSSTHEPTCTTETRSQADRYVPSELRESPSRTASTESWSTPRHESMSFDARDTSAQTEYKPSVAFAQQRAPAASPTQPATTTEGRNSMFADFDRKMQEIRMSLSAIASREPYTGGNTRDAAPPVETPQPNYRGSFEEYLKEFKRDLHQERGYGQGSPSMDKYKASSDRP